VLDRGDIATGGGADGEGELVPPPLSPTLQIPYFPGIPHPARAFGAPPPPPPGGGVRAWRYLVGSRIRLFSRISPCCGPWGYRHGGRGRRGGGTCSPSPVSHTPTILLLAGIPCPHLRRGYPSTSPAPPTPPAPSQGYPYASAGGPHPTRACGAPPPPPPGGGVRAWRYLVGSRIRGDTWWAAVSGMLPAGCRAPGSGVNGGLPERPGIRFSLSVKFDGIPRAGWPISDAVARETS